MSVYRNNPTYFPETLWVWDLWKLWGRSPIPAHCRSPGAQCPSIAVGKTGDPVASPNIFSRMMWSTGLQTSDRGSLRSSCTIVKPRPHGLGMSLSIESIPWDSRWKTPKGSFPRVGNFFSRASRRWYPG